MRVNKLWTALWVLCIQGAVANGVVSAKLLPKRDPCKPLAQGFEAIDDSPAINDALKACGNGGTIVLPANQIYSIRSQIDFSPCKNCEVQIEGRLRVASGLWCYWREVGSTFSMADTTGARIRSVTGKGVVDGNAIEYYTSIYDGREPCTGVPIPFVHVTNGSSDVSFEGLTFKNVMHKFFRVEGNSNSVTFSNLTLTLEDQWGLYPRNENFAGGIEIGRATNIKISNVDMVFKAREGASGPVGMCVAIDVGAHDIAVRDAHCNGAWGGVLVSLRSIDNQVITADDLLDTVSNVYVTGLTFEGAWATGFQSGYLDATMRNITWDGITIVDGNPVVLSLCYFKGHTCTSCPITCMESVAANVTDVYFKNYRGKLTDKEETAKWIYDHKNSTVEYHIEGWSGWETADAEVV